MATHSPRYKITQSGTGWIKRVGKSGPPQWIGSLKKFPTGEAIDAHYETNLGEFLARGRAVTAVTLRKMLAEFLAMKGKANIHKGTLADYDDTCLKLLRAIDNNIDTADLGDEEARAFIASLATMGAARRLKHIRNVRNIVKWATSLTPPFPLGWKIESFPLVTKREMRREKGVRLPYTPPQIRRLMMYANDRLRLMILLGLNLGIGPEELTTLTREDLSGPDFIKPRSKTGVPRLAPIWPEVKARLPKRPGLIFRTKDGGPLATKFPSFSFWRLCKRAGVPLFGMYNLRRTFRTIADDYGDQRAAAKVMGHELKDMGGVYTLTIKRERIEGMLNHVKSSLQMDRALRARRYENWVFGVRRRVSWRASGMRATPTRRRVESSTASPSSCPGSLLAEERQQPSRVVLPPVTVLPSTG